MKLSLMARVWDREQRQWPRNYPLVKPLGKDTRCNPPVNLVQGIATSWHNSWYCYPIGHQLAWPSHAQISLIMQRGDTELQQLLTLAVKMIHSQTEAAQWQADWTGVQGISGKPYISDVVRLQYCQNISHAYYSDVIMSTMASQITGISIVTICLGTDQRKHQSSVSLAFVRGIHRDGGFPSQRAINAENASIWWCHREIQLCISCADITAMNKIIDILT